MLASCATEAAAAESLDLGEPLPRVIWRDHHKIHS
jgi:hypothetical protein